MLERLDAVIGRIRETAERLAPGRAWIGVVSDHGFARADVQLNLFSAFRAAGLLTVTPGQGLRLAGDAVDRGRLRAVMLKDPADAATLERSRSCSTRSRRIPPTASTASSRGGAARARRLSPGRRFLVGLKPGWQTGSSLTGDG